MKNKEIEELLNELKEYASGGMSGLYPSEDTVKNFVSYIEQLEQEVEEYDFLITMQNNREYRSKFLKEFQKEKGKNVYPDYDEIYKRYDEMKVELQEANESITWWQNRFNAVERDKKQLENNRDKARKMIFDNYGVLDKYEIEMLDDILKGDSDE